MFTRLYLHIPWCLAKCDYCAFASAPLPDRALLDETCDLLRAEIDLAPDPSAPLRSIYFGGGTPSVLTPSQIALLLDHIHRRWAIHSDCEITLESNPGTVTPEALNGYRQAGINRLSIGIQSFDNQTLGLLGRIHTGEQAVAAVHAARQAGFGNIGIDLICGLPGQEPAGWQEQLQRAVQLAPEHISIYSLTIEDGTPFAERYPATSTALPDDDRTAVMLEQADQTLRQAGYEQYEIANFARPGFRSQHNSGYWQRDGYLGVGPGAHSFFKQGWGIRSSNPSTYEQWAQEIRNARPRSVATEPLDATEALAETLFLGLRMSDGVDPTACIAEFGEALWSPHIQAIQELVENGLLCCKANGRIALTERGRLLANQVFMRFV